MNSSIFQNSCKFFHFFSLLKNERNVTNFVYVLVTIFYITLENFLGDSA